tara:strand:+ start:267 stop:1970 length:1704 start_codon:yes stop_codon:yes gene_type:complete
MRLVFDIEANGLSEVTLVGPKKKISPEADTIWCLCVIDIDTGKEYSYGPGEISEGVKLLNKATLLIGHNIIGYDIPMLERVHGKISDCKIFDTLIASRLKYPDRDNHPFGGNSLRSWGIHLGCFKDDYDKGFDSYCKEMLSYCKQDVEVTLRVYEALKNVEEEMSLPFAIEHAIAKIIAEQTDNGMGFDLQGAHDLEQELIMERVTIEDEFNTLFPPIVEKRFHKTTGKPLKDKITYFNPGSRKMIAERLGEKYGWIPPKTDKGNAKVDEAVLKELKYPEAEKLIEYFYIIKLLGFIRDWITRAVNSRDGRIHCSINTQGAVSGRMTCSQPNLQQVSSDPRARSLFKPRDGWVQVGIDASGLEARLLASRMAKYDDGSFGEVVLNGDIHSANQEAAGLPTRDSAKTFFFALIYGAGDGKIGSIVGKGAKAGKEVKETFFKKMPALKKVLDNCHFQIAKKGTVTLLDNREVPCRAKHKALNVQIQGDGAILMKVAQAIFRKKLEAKYPEQYSFMMTVHDEWQVECDPVIAEDVGALGCKSIEEAAVFLNCRIKMEGNAIIGFNWKECH